MSAIPLDCRIKQICFGQSLLSCLDGIDLRIQKLKFDRDTRIAMTQLQYALLLLAVIKWTHSPTTWLQQYLCMSIYAAANLGLRAERRQRSNISWLIELLVRERALLPVPHVSKAIFGSAPAGKGKWVLVTIRVYCSTWNAAQALAEVVSISLKKLLHDIRQVFGVSLVYVARRWLETFNTTEIP